MMKCKIPYVLTRESSESNWLDDFSWPVDPKKALRINDRVMRRFNSFVNRLDGDRRRIVLLARGIDDAVTMIEAAFVAISSSSDQIENVVLDWIRSGVVEGKDIRICLKRMGDRFRIKKIPFATCRQIVRTYSWSGFQRLIPSLAFPDILAVTHNSLLVSEARRENVRMSFKHSEPLLNRYIEKLRSKLSGEARDDVHELAEELTRELMNDESLTSELREKLVKLFLPHCNRLLTEAAEVLASLKKVRNMPRILWTGNGGYYSSRALGLEVLRREGVVRRFDHGGTASLMDCCDYLTQQELAVSSEFVLPTEAAASLPIINEAARSIPQNHPIRLIAGHGDPGLRPSENSLSKPNSGRPNVMFIGTAYYGFYQSTPPFLPAPLYLEWQMSVLKILRKFDVNLVHRPHPGGVFMGCPPALESVAPLERRKFEIAIEDADILIFDYAGSTTFSVALSSNRPMILLDYGSLKFQPAVNAAVRERCRVVDVHIDSRNRLRVDEERLRDAVCGSHNHPDPGFFRNLFLGE